MFARKGMSPLIATILLIAFAVALGAMIMNWSSGLDEGLSPVGGDDACSAVSIRLNQAFGRDIFCYAEGNLRFNIVNDGKGAISGLQLRTVDPNLREVKQDLSASALSVGDTYTYEDTFDKSGKVHAEIVPFITVDGEDSYCVNKAIIQDVVPDCDN